MTWREYYRPIIAEIIKKHPNDCKQRRKALYDAYPAGERKYYPYKVWLDEVARQTGKKYPLYTEKKIEYGDQLKLMG